MRGRAVGLVAVLVVAAGAGATAGKNLSVPVLSEVEGSPGSLPNTNQTANPETAGPEAERAAFEAAVRSPDAEVRARAIAKIEDDDDWAFPALERAASDPDGNVRLAVALALEELGGDDRAEAAFEKLVRDPLPIVRSLACRAVSGSRGARLGEALRRALDDPAP